MKTLTKIIFCFSIVLTGILQLACSRAPVTENKDVDSTFVQSDSSVYVEERAALESELTDLRNYIDTTIFVLAERKAKLKGDAATPLENAITDLSLNKEKVERDLQEVNTTSLNSWDSDYTARIRTTMKQVRMDCDRITSGLLSEK